MNTNPMQLNFTTKEEYLAWRNNWRATYKELSEAIRQQRSLSRQVTSALAKRHSRLAQKGNPPTAVWDDAYLVDLDHRANLARERLTKATNGRLHAASAIATELLELRKASKAEAGRQYAAQQQVVAA